MFLSSSRSRCPWHQCQFPATLCMRVADRARVGPSSGRRSLAMSTSTRRNAPGYVYLRLCFIFVATFFYFCRDLFFVQRRKAEDQVPVQGRGILQRCFGGANNAQAGLFLLLLRCVMSHLITPLRSLHRLLESPASVEQEQSHIVLILLLRPCYPTSSLGYPLFVVSHKPSTPWCPAVQ